MPAACPTSTGGRSILEQLDSVTELRPFPAVATRVMAACQDPQGSLRSIAQMIECDAGYASRLLRMANSSVYGFTGSIRTVQQAIVVLGLRQVKNLAVSLAGAEIFSQGRTAAEQRAALWEHSLGCAAVTRLLAVRCGNGHPDEAFLAGIFHDVGKLVLYDLAAEQYSELAADSSGQDLVQLEIEAFGISHAEVGMRCGQSWGLAEEVNRAIGFHHCSDQAGGEDGLASLVSAADLVSRAWGVGWSGSEPEAEALGPSLESLELDEAALDATRQQALEQFQELKQVCVA